MIVAEIMLELHDDGSLRIFGGGSPCVREWARKHGTVIVSREPLNEYAPEPITVEAATDAP